MRQDIEFSYAGPGDAPLKRLVIRMIERLTGQPQLRRLYLENQRAPRIGESFWAAAVRQLRLQVEFDPARLAAIPAQGPVVMVANHPFGVLDGIVISYLVAQVRREFKVLTHSLLNRAHEVQPFLLPVDFSESRDALATNLRTRAEARALLQAGGAVVVFPGGMVSTVPTPLDRLAFDPAWKPFTAGLIQQARATVVPMYFAGQNSRLFQLASHVSYTLRLSLLFNEVRRRIGDTVRVEIGSPIPYPDLARLRDRQVLIDDLRRRTYQLGGHRSAGVLTRPSITGAKERPERAPSAA